MVGDTGRVRNSHGVVIIMSKVNSWVCRTVGTHRFSQYLVNASLVENTFSAAYSLIACMDSAVRKTKSSAHNEDGDALLTR